LLITVKTTRGKTMKIPKGRICTPWRLLEDLDKTCGWESVVTVPQAELMANIPFSL
jgi:hypothetical protein